MAALLELRNLETYYGPVMAIRGVSLEVREGQIVTLLGANGAGKTTVLKTVCGAMDPQKGSVKLSGKEIQTLDPDVIARKGIAHVPEGRGKIGDLGCGTGLFLSDIRRREPSAVGIGVP